MVHHKDVSLKMGSKEKTLNRNMEDEFNPYCNSVVEKIMIECYYKFAPGFMCVGRKPYPFGIERHKICCGLTSVFRGRIFFRKMM